MNANIPFLHPQALLAQHLPLPDKIVTAQALPPLNLAASTEVNQALQGYRTFYGLDQLATQHGQGYLDSAGYRIHVQVFQPQTPLVARGTVWLIHGYLEHSAIYQPIIGEILAQQFNVVTFDLPGHGLSSGLEASIHDFADYQQILQDLNRYILRYAPFQGIQLGVGQSTGGAILMDHLLTHAEMRREPMIRRALLLSPLLKPAKSAWWQTPTGLGLVRRIVRKVPRHFKRNNHNPEFLRFVRLQDPLQARSMSMEWILAMSRWITMMEQRKPCRIPVWVAQGALDQTVDWRYNLNYIRRQFRLQTCLMLEEGSHQLINERADIRAALTGLIPAFLHAPTKANFYQ